MPLLNEGLNENTPSFSFSIFFTYNRDQRVTLILFETFSDLTMYSCFRRDISKSARL